MFGGMREGFDRVVVYVSNEDDEYQQKDEGKEDREADNDEIEFLVPAIEDVL